MSRQELVTALCDIYGYCTSDFKNQCLTDIWWYLEPTEQEAVKEYVGVQHELQAIELV